MSEWATSYNSRSVSPAQIAAIFVKPPEFEDILKFENMVLVGPRGTGKTTILKLMTPTGLHHWFRRSDVAKSRLDYIPIYIPADTLWKGEAKAIDSRPGLDGYGDVIQNGIFVDYCLYETIASLEDAKNVARFYETSTSPGWTVNIDRDQEALIAENCSRFWKLNRVESSFLGLKLSLLTRMNLFSSFVNSFTPPPLENLFTLPRLSLLSMFRGFFDIVEAVTGRCRWSINFDEMEIAPESVLKMLYENLRSFDQRAVLKFSLFPYGDFLSSSPSKDDGLDSGALRVAPIEGQDFRAVRLSGKFRSEKYDFADSLVKGICQAQGISFGEFTDYVNKSDEMPTYRVQGGSRTYRHFAHLFSSLSRKDSGFRKYIRDNDINVDNLRSYDENKMASLVRKVAPVVEFRDRYLRDKQGAGSSAVRRARKGYGYYHGYQQILRITESNPRAVNFYVNDLISALKANRQSQTVQNLIIAKNVDRFRAMVATQVVSTEGPVTGSRNALSVTDSLGKNLSRIVLGNRFLTEPPLSYQIVDMDAETLKIIGIAVNTGALIVDSGPNDQSLVVDLKGVRLRVSYQMAPFYPLPTITGQMLKIQRLPTKAEDSDQPDLIGWQFNEV
ncbi:hypothetical protein [Mesorhizobium sp. B1-1-7]|uniref:ORC-CDC6 family AAA ATPase n=1 Tax=Mesorhizobium sp. B1-1-7 TaxID=2589977 RepID=UPI00112E4021|nr:hypothetical protein [Mesorhizobium sp. B1-1-7]TPN47745.1 hypothetical protein FJ978_22870 [Mesorhizobium sp. B1-1-7]